MQATLAEFKSQDGTLPAYAWPGGYPILYTFQDGSVCCPACANNENGSHARTAPDPADPGSDSQWLLVGYFVHWEGPAESCAHCNASIESAYGDSDKGGN